MNPIVRDNTPAVLRQRSLNSSAGPINHQEMVNGHFGTTFMTVVDHSQYSPEYGQTDINREPVVE